MKKSRSSSNSLASLRKKAEKKLKEQTEKAKKLSARDVRDLAHELGTHQIELEMQNEELRRAQEELEASRGKYAELYDFAPVGYFTFDKNGLIREVNLTAASLLGIERRSLVNRPFSTLVGKDDRDAFRRHCSAVLEKRTKQTLELRLKRRDGTEFFALLESIAVEEQEGNSLSIRTAASDITGRKRAEEAVKQAYAELAAMNKELEAFSYAVSNDLRAPLRTIEGFTNAILEDHAAALDETAKDYFNRVAAASRRMDQLIEAMLNIARLTKSELREQTVDLSGLAEVAAYELRKKDPSRKVAFVIAKGVRTRGDTDMLRMVVGNLMDNAWKFTSRHPSARIEFGVFEHGMRNGEGRTKNVPSGYDSAIRNPKSEIVYFVRDDGEGFDMAFADKLFKPFQRLHKESEFPGLGIGLATVKRIVERHGGKIWVESAPDKGATFFFTLG